MAAAFVGTPLVPAAGPTMRASSAMLRAPPVAAARHAPLSGRTTVPPLAAGHAAAGMATVAVCLAARSAAAQRQRRQNPARAPLIRALATAEDTKAAPQIGYNSAVGGRTRIGQLLDAADGGKSLIGSTVAVCGWVRTVRKQKGITFVKINDGSTFQELQAVVEEGAEGLEEISNQGAGASVRIVGEVVASPAKGQEVEIKCNKPEHGVKVLGGADGASYPLAKKRHSIEYLRQIAHLRPRSNIIGAVSRVRNTLAAATHEFFQKRSFLYVHTPIITTADCEGAGEMFRIVTADPLEKKAEGDSDEFFGQPAFLTVSGQLAAENFACSLGDVYTFGPTFRAENSSTTRHLAEFWMIEPEMAFADLQDDMNCAEEYIRFCAQQVLEKNKHDLDFFNQRVDKELMDRLKLIAGEPFKRMTYTEAVEVLTKEVESGAANFEYEVAWGKELQTEHEKWLTDKLYKRPTIVYNYPKDCKAFYMRQNEDGKTVAAMDILCPGIGELVGGSQREERLELLDERIAEQGMDKEGLWWYRELRQYGSVPHAGFGVGFERLVMLCTGVQNIRDVIPFPRYPGHAAF